MVEVEGVESTVTVRLIVSRWGSAVVDIVYGVVREVQDNGAGVVEKHEAEQAKLFHRRSI